MDRVSLFPVEHNRAWFSIGGAEELHGGKGGVGKLCDSLWRNLEFVTAVSQKGIWVSFCRAGILADLCHFFKSRASV